METVELTERNGNLHRTNHDFQTETTTVWNRLLLLTPCDIMNELLL